MKIWAIVIVFVFTSFALYAKPKFVKRIEPGRWAFSFQGFGDLPMNDGIRKQYRSGMGIGGRIGYGFWKGMSVEGDFQYDLLFLDKDEKTPSRRGNKNLWTVAPGLRYTVNLIQEDIAWYGLALMGLTFDYTKGENEHGDDTSFNFNYALGTGIDINLTENLSVGPIFKYRYFIADADIHLICIGAAFSYLFD